MESRRCQRCRPKTGRKEPQGKRNGRCRKKSLTGDEYLSRFAKADRLRPVITLVLYCGEEPWNGARCLHEMLDFKNISDKVKKYVADYPVHILDVCHTADERLRQFPSDICFLLMSMKYAKDKEAFSRLKELTGTAVISEDTYETIAEYLGEPEWKWRKYSNRAGHPVFLLDRLLFIVNLGRLDNLVSFFVLDIFRILI